MKKLLACALCCVAALSILVQSSLAGDTWKIGHVRPTGSAVDKDLQKFTATVRQQSGDKIKFNIYAANKLGDYSVVQERVAFGEVEMFLGPFGTAVDRRVSLAWTPFLVETWEQAEKMYSPDSPLIKYMESYLKAQNIKIIGGWPVYFGGIGLTGKPRFPADPDVKKNVIIRVPPIRSFEITARELGFTPYPITWKYAQMGLKTGMVGGLIGGGAEGYAALSENIRYYLPVKDHFEYWFLYINLDLWNSLSDEHREILTGAARTMEEERFRVASKQEKASFAELNIRGVTILEISDKQYGYMRDKVRAAVWPSLRDDLGPAFDKVVEFLKEEK
ncbi:TRAP transporter substrate-binding protein DctP [Desulforhopalus singaporensis]|uniref:TRAP-type C4-dicarboxylate transport system, substrate-binding protein n=1 Tax=Desulforhopalus singaporensis TaxID=91360 RepID=A0A1H0KK40_9BACT|nr:TRAP transporter substrate-binding protein DctP [Desulforhopalus singaporensis]SDO56101.1 TRAP-type C4-dicarboxylate transport system, substrate-binding protein [Desulforhopalus singaporensis]